MKADDKWEINSIGQLHRFILQGRYSERDCAKKIFELDQDRKLLELIIGGIDLLMHDKQYRYRNEDGTWYSREVCKSLSIQELYQEIMGEIEQLQSQINDLEDRWDITTYTYNHKEKKDDENNN